MKEVRLKRIESVVYRELADILASIGRNFFPGKLISVSAVKVTPDLSFARVYVSVYPYKDAEQIMKELEFNIKEIRYTFAQRVRHQLRKIPELRFYLDDSMERVDRITKILEKHKKENSDNNQK